MNKAEIYAFLDAQGLWYEVTEHQAVYNMSEISSVPLPHPDADAKNLFVRDDKKRSYYLITVKGDKRVDLKDLRRQNGTRPLTFASPEDLRQLLELAPGSVTPLGLLNDAARRVEMFLDQAFLDPPGLIGVHPNDNTATVWLKTEDLIALLKNHGTTLHLAEF